MTTKNLKELFLEYSEEKRLCYFPQAKGPTRVGIIEHVGDTFIVLQNDRKPSLKWTIFNSDLQANGFSSNPPEPENLPPEPIIMLDISDEAKDEN